MNERARRWAALGVAVAVGWSIPAGATNPHHDDDDDASMHDGDRRTLFVDDDRQQCPNAQFTSIQAAVLAAPPGGHLHVCPGLYHETVEVDRPLRIHGSGPAPKNRTGDPSREAVLVPAPDFGFFVEASDTEIAGFTITGTNGTTIAVTFITTGTGNTARRNFFRDHFIGVELLVGGPNRRPSLIADNRVEGCSVGIAIYNPLGPAPDVTPALLTIRQNTLAQNSTGVLLEGMRGVTVKMNSLTDFGTGIDVHESAQISVLQNELETGGFSDAGISLRNDSANSVFGNEVRGRFHGPSVAGIELDGSLGDVVVLNRISRMQGDGVLLAGATGNTVALNRSDDNGNDGIDLHGSSDNELMLNTMHDNFAFDASDDSRDDNVWDHNRCDTDFPPGTICTDHSHGP